MSMNFGEAATPGSEAVQIPRWQKDLGLKPDDPAIPQLTAISKHFQGLQLPPFFQSRARLAALTPSRLLTDREQAELLQAQSSPTWALRESPENPDFRYGVNYFFGQNKGQPQSVPQNALAARFQEVERGVELWRIMKSVAFSTPDKKIVIAHVRGDCEVDMAMLASRVGVNETDLTRADVSTLGVEYGTVNPFIPASEQVEHVFDRDLVDGKEYPCDDIVFTSPGDPRFYVGFDVKRYVRAISQMTATMATVGISKKIEPEKQRVVARRPITILGGDSTGDTANFKKQVATSVTESLEKHDAYFGDRSLPIIDAKSDPAFAGSINTDLYGETLKDHVADVADELKNALAHEGPRPLVAFSSRAMDGVGGQMLRQVEGIEYIGSQEALAQILDALAKQNVGISRDILLGLPSAYDKERSAFAGSILDNALPVNVNVRRSIQEFVQDCKKEEGNPEKFYKNIVDTVLRQATKGQLDTLKNENIAVILGASELESFAGALEDYANTNEKIRATFAVIKSNDPTTIVAEVAKTPDKIRLILIQPGQAVADMIAQKTLGIET